MVHGEPVQEIGVLQGIGSIIIFRMIPQQSLILQTAQAAM